MNRILAWGGNFLLILLAVFCTLCTIISTYDFTVNIWQLLLFWMIAAAPLSALVTCLRGKGLLICLPLVLIALIFLFPQALAGGKAVTFSITNEFSVWTSVPVLFRGAYASADELAAFFAAAGLVLELLLSAAVCSRYSAALTFLFTFPLVVITVLDVNFVPNFWFLIGLIAVYLIMLVGSRSHPTDFIRRSKSVFPALMLVGVFFALTYLVASPGRHDRGDLIASLESRVEDFMAEVNPALAPSGTGWPDISTDVWHFNTENVEIQNAGRRTIADKSILEVSADQAGTFYLRGYAMQYFDGRAWSGNSDSPALDGESLAMLQPSDLIRRYNQLYPDNALPQANMTISKTGDRSGIDYMPYYSLSYSYDPYADFSYSGDNPPTESAFFYVRGGILGIAAALPPDASADLSNYNAQAQAIYTQVDASTAEGLRQLAAQAGIDADSDRSVIADQVAQYVSSAARYTLSPSAFPDDEDFALYFLQTSKQGYCIHFATAATLMLRALNVPARFTSGFTVTVSGGNIGETLVVTDRQAHAWVEVYYDGVGWVPLEVTPSSSGSGIPAMTSHSDIDAAQAVETAPPAATPAPQEQPGGPAQNGTDASAKTGATGAAAVLRVLLLAALVMAALFLRRHIARKNRARAFAQADKNAAVICAWRYISRLHGRSTQPPAEIEQLVLKARFSQHTISEEEYLAVTDYAARLSEETDRQCNFFQKLWLRYVRGLY